MKCKYEGEGRYEGRCMGTKEIDPCPGYDKCSHFKSNLKTNADHIRAMSDEELCEFLSQYSIFKMCDEGCDACSYKGDCDKRLLEWLKQPWEENTDEV